MPHRSGRIATVFATLVAIVTIARSTIVSVAAEPNIADLEYQFTDKVRPILTANCFTCHSGGKKEGDLDLGTFGTMADVIKDYGRFETVRERLEAKEMPPSKAKQQPTAEERQLIVDWINGLRKQVAKESAGDPGPVLARRLSNAEFNYTVRDLTGQDIQPTKEFPVDPANEAGFDNSGESLAMSPALVKKYLDAARDVAQHIVLKPDGFVFAAYPIVNDAGHRRPEQGQPQVPGNVMDRTRRQPGGCRSDGQGTDDVPRAAAPHDQRAERGPRGV
jgi:mono/diheme cytochrome c family protein